MSALVNQQPVSLTHRLCGGVGARYLTTMIALALFAHGGLVKSATAAGCHLAAGSVQRLAVDDALPLVASLEVSLAGQWQYAGGRVYYLFHPLPTPCDGPNCRQAPDPGSEMAAIPTAPRRVVPECAYLPMRIVEQEDSYQLQTLFHNFCLEPARDTLLRPPCASV